MKRRQFIESLVASGFALGSQPLLSAAHLNQEALLLAGASNPAEQIDGQDLSNEFFYRPQGAWSADYIPFYKNGEYYLFYLLDWRDRAAHGEGTPWYLVTTKDFVHFTDHGQMLARGTKNDQDLYVFTGSVVEGEGKYHIFYTGHNPYFPAQGKPEQAIMHATSDDLLHWTKVPEDTFYAPTEHFEPNDWRDPFVFWNQEAGEYWMLVAARLKSGPSRRRGCTGLCTSKDLKTWKIQKPFWSPGLYYTHECPDLFRVGDWWYLVFSEFTDLIRTRYRMSRSLNGPWLTPRWDYFDARDYYAAKTSSDGKQRFLFGWNPTRAERKDYYTWDWGGNLVVHELKQESDGSLSVHIPRTVDEVWKKPGAVAFSRELGNVKHGDNRIEIAALGSFSCSAAGKMPDRCKIEVQVEFKPGTRRCGIMLRTSDDMENSYYLRLEPDNHRMVFDMWPRSAGSGQKVSIDGGYMPGLERWVDLSPGRPLELKILVDRTIGVVYAGDQIAMNVRMYDLPSGLWGFFVDQGNATFHNFRISQE